MPAIRGAMQTDTDITTYFFTGSGVPESVQVAPIGSLYLRTDVGTLYVKGTGVGNTGWKLVTQAV